MEERTAKFGEGIIDFVRIMKLNVVTKLIINQLIRSATSIGANYMEVNHASSKKDFKNKISICIKEANETRHWLRMLAKAAPEKSEECKKLWQEAHELTLIFATIKKKCSLNCLKVKI